MMEILILIRWEFYIEVVSVYGSTSRELGIQLFALCYAVLWFGVDQS